MGLLLCGSELFKLENRLDAYKAFIASARIVLSETVHVLYAFQSDLTSIKQLV